jgi:hypothetical protein
LGRVVYPRPLDGIQRKREATLPNPETICREQFLWVSVLLVTQTIHLSAEDIRLDSLDPSGELHAVVQIPQCRQILVPQLNSTVSDLQLNSFGKRHFLEGRVR